MMKLNDYPLIAVILMAAGLPALDAADAADTSLAATSNVPIEAADAKIVGVTVYADRARVTRSATIQVPPGASAVEIGALTTNLDESTVEVRGRSSGLVTIRGVDVRQEFLVEDANRQAAELQHQLDELLEQKTLVDSQIALLNSRKAFFENLSSGIGRSDKGVPQIDDLKKLYDFYSEELTTVSNSLLDTQAKLRTQQREIDRLKQELSGLSQQKSSRKVVISVQAEKPEELELTLFYTVHNASWEPIYDARLNTTDGSVLLSYNAYVRQRTGEEWEGVKLTVSTARPAENGELPELKPVYLSLNSPLPSDAVPAQAQFRAKQAAPTSVAEQPVNPEPAKLETSGLAITYVVAQPLSVPSDGQPHLTNLTQIKLNGDLSYVCTPKLELAAFVKVHLTNSSEDTLLAGAVNLFRDGDLMGSLQLPQIVSGQEFDLFGGRDDAIRVDRKELVDRTAQSGFFNSRKQRARKFQISVQNYRKSPVKLALSDQVPVSQDNQVSVTQGQISPKPTDFDKDTGKLTWKMDLNPNEKKVVELEYTIEWPADKMISGAE
ncbi:MAG TPA: mucoidy inhibitor MuiA family protein [Chthoniobacterales bacterium]|nr:mucoidy inhibitor MuiA family protein [Chthoniobacterales bacterium]